MVSIPIIQARALELGYEYISGDYVTNRTKLSFKCQKAGHLIDKSWDQLNDKRNRGCIKCSGKVKLTEDEITKRFSELGGTITKIENAQYGKDNRSTRVIHFTCREGHDSKIYIHSIKKAINQGTNGCRQCSTAKSKKIDQ